MNHKLIQIILCMAFSPLATLISSALYLKKLSPLLTKCSIGDGSVRSITSLTASASGVSWLLGVFSIFYKSKGLNLPLSSAQYFSTASLNSK